MMLWGSGQIKWFLKDGDLGIFVSIKEESLDKIWKLKKKDIKERLKDLEKDKIKA